MNIYFISGLGADYRAFAKLDWKDPEYNSTYKIKYIEWQSPSKKESIESYAKKLSTQINQQEKFVLVGLSFGGIIALEMNKFLKPEKTILISSILKSDHKPNTFKLLNYIPLHRTLLCQWIVKSPLLLSKVFKLGNKKSELRKQFIGMLQSMPEHFIEWGIRKMVDWKFDIEIPNVVQLHGTRDEIFEIKKPNYIIEKGSHLMVYTKAKEITEILKLEISKIKY